jgi:hypothetical protein
MEDINIEKVFFPDSNVLRDDGTATIIDAELDPIECEFNNDECVKLNTKDYAYITLTAENLLTLLDMIEETEIS